jgi:hypothetical protein
MHDAGDELGRMGAHMTAWAWPARVRRGELTPAELARQAAAGIAKDQPGAERRGRGLRRRGRRPAAGRRWMRGFFAGVPFLMKDLGPTMKGRLQEHGLAVHARQPAAADSFLTGRMRQAGLNLMGRTTTPEFGVCSSAENPAVYVTRNPWDRDYTTCGSSAGTAAMVAAGVLPTVARHRRRRLDPHPRRLQRQHRAQALARRVLDRAAPVGPHRAGVDPGLPQPHGARHRGLRRPLPRRCARRIHALLDARPSPMRS